jgi:hypothetical protein
MNTVESTLSNLLMQSSNMLKEYREACNGNINIDAEQIAKYLFMEKYNGVYIEPVSEYVDDIEYKGQDHTYKKIASIDYYWHDWHPKGRDAVLIKESINNILYNYNGGSSKDTQR